MNDKLKRIAHITQFMLDKQKNALSARLDEEALVLGIREQNAKYDKLLTFVKEVSSYDPEWFDHDTIIKARELLKEIGSENK